MGASKILKALLKHHVQRLGTVSDPTNTSIVNLKSTAKLELSSDIAGELMANRFAHAASMALAPQECTQLQAFLEDCPRAMSPRSQEHWDEDRLCTPSGEEDAESLIVLQDIAHPVGPFWDPTTFSIQTLAVKGYSTDFLYGFDWHWRAEETCVGRGRCSAAKWPQNLKRLHDDHSSSLLNLLPSRFALVGGECARIHVRKSIDPSTAAQRRSFSVLVNSALGLNLEFDLILVDEKVNRIITYVNHPSAIYFENPNSLGLSSIQFGAASNFILWLLGKPHDPTVIQRRNVGISFSKIIAAPISDMRRYMALEKKDHRSLHHSEYLDQFLSWARRYLGDEYNMAVRDERSIAGACAEKMNRRAWTARIQKFLTEHKFRITGSNVTDRCTTEHAARLRDEEVDQYNDKDPSSVRYSKDAVTSVPQPRTDFSVTEFELMQRRINQVVTENRAYRPKSEEQELWEGRQVEMHSNGTISMRVPWRKRPLSLVVSPQARKNIKRFGVSPTIHFLPDGVKLQPGQEVLFSRSTIFMRNGQDGEDWERQIRKELGAKGYFGLGQELWEPGLAPRTESDCMQATLPSCRAGYNADHRMKLLKGDHFYCGERDDKYGRVTLRGPLFVLVPRHADFRTVWIHCDLLEKVLEHPETCAKNALDGDPAKRLGIELRFNSKKSSIVEEIWMKMATDSDTKKINSLVNFLDGADEEYRAKQPRRFLAQKKGKNGRPATYT